MSVSSSGLYAVKPRFQQLLSGPADALVARGVHPDVLTFAGLGCAVAGGAAIIRTHDVAETVQALRVAAAIGSAR